MIQSRSDSVIAYHEAGHAVAAYALRRGIERASIVRGDGKDGVVTTTTLARGQLNRLARDVVIALAGTSAERRYRGGKYDRCASESDFALARTLLREISTRRGEDPEIVDRPRMALCIDLGNRIVDRHWQEVKSFADELLRRQRLSGPAVREALARSWTSDSWWALIDIKDLLTAVPLELRELDVTAQE